jgi:putative ABC transport system permease protein
MVKPSWRKILNDLWDDKARSLLVVISIAIGVFALGMIAGAHVIISEDMNASYIAANPANIKLVTDSFDKNLEQTIQRMPDVQDAQGRRKITVRVRKDGGDWYNLDLIAVDDFEKIGINRIVHLQGSTRLGDRQIMLEENKKAERRNLELGDLLEIELTNGTIRQMPVVGTIQDETSGTGNLVGNVQGYISLKTLEWLHYPESYNQLYITVSGDQNDRTHIQQVATLVEDKLNKSGRNVYRTEILLRQQHPMGSIIEALLGVLLAMGVLIVFLSGSLIANTLSALLTQHVRQIGVMKLTGARSNQIIWMYVTLILIFAISALILAVPLGILAAYALSDYATSFIGFSLLGFRIVPIAILLQVVVAILVTLLAGLSPVIQGSRTTIQKAFSGAVLGGGVMKQGLIEWFISRFRRVSRLLLISLRNTFREKKGWH